MIVDASVAVKWVIDEDGSDVARTLAARELEAPDLLLIECANILWKKIVADDLSPAEAALALKELRSAPISLAPSAQLLRAALALAGELRHPIYDCVYLALAIDRKSPFITADKRLARVVQRSIHSRVKVMLLDELEV